MSSVLAALAPGTQWSQKPNVSLPAACAPRTYGAVINAADVSAVAATNCRRESFLRDMTYSLPGAMMSKTQLAVLVSPSAGLGRSDGCRGDVEISLDQSEQNCRRLSRNQLVPVLELMLRMAATGLLSHP